MAAMKPRTGDGPMEVTKEARSLVMRIPLEGGGRLVVELNQEEARNLADVLNTAVSLIKKGIDPSRNWDHARSKTHRESR